LANDTIIKRKAKLGAKGYNQKYGIDYKKKFAPLLNHYSLSMITALASEKNFNIKLI